MSSSYMRAAPILIAASLWAACVGARAGVPDSPNDVVPAAVGSKAPAFTAREMDDSVFAFKPDTLRQPTLLIFYRGGWCPYCNMHLQDLRTVEPQIVKLGYQVIFLSTDRPALLYLSLKEKVDYHIVSDSAMNASQAFGVAYRVDSGTLEKMKTLGVDLEATQGTTRHELPVPAVFIVDRHGIIRFRHYNANYQVRLDAASVLKAARDSLHSDQ